MAKDDWTEHIRMSQTPFQALKVWMLLILLSPLCIAVPSAHAQPHEYIVKAEFIERFTRFTEWPDESQINDTSKSFILGVIGEENHFAATLEEIFTTKKIRGKKVVVRRFSEPNEASQCDLLFIAEVTKRKLLKILSYTKNKPILTVSDSESFARSGVLINFVIRNNKIRFEINEKAVQESKLTISYLLLQAATIVNPVRSEQR